MEYKLSTINKNDIISYLSSIGIEWDGTQTPLTFDKGTFVYIGQIIDTFDYIKDTNGNNIGIENIKFIPGFHFDLLTEDGLIFPSTITRVYPSNPRHTFGEYIKPIE